MSLRLLCPDPELLRDAVFEGSQALPPRLRAHVEGCQGCQRRLSELRMVEHACAEEERRRRSNDGIDWAAQLDRTMAALPSERRGFGKQLLPVAAAVVAAVGIALVVVRPWNNPSGLADEGRRIGRDLLVEPHDGFEDDAGDLPLGPLVADLLPAGEGEDHLNPGPASALDLALHGAPGTWPPEPSATADADFWFERPGLWLDDLDDLDVAQQRALLRRL